MPSRPRSLSVATLGSCRNGAGSTWLAPGWATQTVPSRSATSIRPSGVNVSAVGSSRPRITRSLTNSGSGAHGAAVTVMVACAERLPAASKASTPTSWLAPQVSPVIVVLVVVVEPAGEPSRGRGRSR